MIKIDNAIKIILAGLDYAGKSSILTALDHKFDFEKIVAELKPTIKVEYNKRKFLNFTIYIWDCGGQEKYRSLYEKNKDAYFSDTNLLLFIIDVQDQKRYDKALNYLNSVVLFIQSNRIDVEFSVFLHKYDPALEVLEEYSPSQINEKLLKKINEIIPSDISYNTFKTCIYSVFQKTKIS